MLSSNIIFIYCLQMTLLKNQFKVFLLHLIILCCIFEQSIDYHSFHRLNRRKTKRNNCVFLFL